MMVVISAFCKGGEQRQRRTNGHRLALAASMMSGSGGGSSSGGLGWNVEKHSRGLVEFIPRAAYVQTRETEVVSV